MMIRKDDLNVDYPLVSPIRHGMSQITRTETGREA
jgi:hypothetical protein